ncbi:DUF7344 domain-containing protein [Haloglomus litoreum]|uniref:DUF7344 domain-containing protein n=1 Tax=Haloglomus litoreum TaxID=3034026 RepID=UPI0023E7F72E|nr:hypothetical protein [Haloglomus sp. DT116]
MISELDESPDEGTGDPPTDETAQARPSATPGGGARPSLDGMFGVLRNDRRRAVLRYLDSRAAPVEIGAVAEHIAALENEKPPELLHSLERKRVYVALYQFHLPKMADAGVIEFAKDRGRITPGPDFERVRRYLDGHHTGQDDWPYRYLLTGVGLLAVITLTWLTGTLAMATTAVVGGTLLLSLYSAVNWLEHVLTCRHPPGDR